MRILIANDDGYLAPGLAALVRACESLGEVDVIAPEQNASGTSNALTLSRPLSVFEAPGFDRSRLYRVVNGTPSDCVHVALTGLLPHRPDLVLSGINNGANMGDDTLYSGTVAAAMEGYLFGLRSIAFSQVDKGWGDLDADGDALADGGAQAAASRPTSSRPSIEPSSGSTACSGCGISPQTLPAALVMQATRSVAPLTSSA